LKNERANDLKKRTIEIDTSKYAHHQREEGDEGSSSHELSNDASTKWLDSMIDTLRSDSRLLKRKETRDKIKQEIFKCLSDVRPDSLVRAKALTELCNFIAAGDKDFLNSLRAYPTGYHGRSIMSFSLSKSVTS
jgi:hypothetical protein